MRAPQALPLRADFTGGFSPGPTSHAIVSPTGITAPTSAVIPARIPSPGASTSTTALSVSISSSGSPFADAFTFFFSPGQQLPGFLRHFQRRHHHADRHSFCAEPGTQLQSVAATPSIFALSATISFTRLLGGCSFSRVVESGPLTVK